jgi:hypothetical protein
MESAAGGTGADLVAGETGTKAAAELLLSAILGQTAYYQVKGSPL